MARARALYLRTAGAHAGRGGSRIDAPGDVEVRRIGQHYLDEVDRLFTTLLVACGLDARRASDTSGALMALATGAVTLRKAGAPEERVRAMLDVARRWLD